MKKSLRSLPSPPKGLVIKRVHTAPETLKKLPQATRRRLEAFRLSAIAELKRATRTPPSSAPLRRREMLTGSGRLRLVG